MVNAVQQNQNIQAIQNGANNRQDPSFRDAALQTVASNVDLSPRYGHAVGKDMAAIENAIVALFEALENPPVTVKQLTKLLENLGNAVEKLMKNKAWTAAEHYAKKDLIAELNKFFPQSIKINGKTVSNPLYYFLNPILNEKKGKKTPNIAASAAKQANEILNGNYPNGLVGALAKELENEFLDNLYSKRHVMKLPPSSLPLLPIQPPKTS